MKRVLLAVSFFVVLMLAWELCVRARVWPKVLVPSPLSVVEYLYGAVADGTLLLASWVTLTWNTRAIRDRVSPARTVYSMNSGGGKASGNSAATAAGAESCWAGS